MYQNQINKFKFKWGVKLFGDVAKKLCILDINYSLDNAYVE